MNEPIVLDVSKIMLTVLSPHIKHLNKLWVLLLSDNQLTKLPDEIGELKELERLNVRMDYWRLDLSNNQLRRKLNEPIVLDVGKIRLTVLSSHIKHLNKLWVLLLSDN